MNTNESTAIKWSQDATKHLKAAQTARLSTELTQEEREDIWMAEMALSNASLHMALRKSNNEE